MQQNYSHRGDIIVFLLISVYCLLLSQAGGQPSPPVERIQGQCVTILSPKSALTRHLCLVDVLGLSEPTLPIYLTWKHGYNLHAINIVYSMLERVVVNKHVHTFSSQPCPGSHIFLMATIH